MLVHRAVARAAHRPRRGAGRPPPPAATAQAGAHGLVDTVDDAAPAGPIDYGTTADAVAAPQVRTSADAHRIGAWSQAARWPLSVIHALLRPDIGQRLVELDFRQDGRRLAVDAPANTNLAPPGRCLLFVLDDAGVPSVAKIIRLGGTPAPTPERAQVGSITLAQREAGARHRVAFDRPVTRTPMVNFGGVSSGGGQSVMPRVRAVDRRGYQLRLRGSDARVRRQEDASCDRERRQEDASCDRERRHARERIGWVVVGSR